MPTVGLRIRHHPNLKDARMILGFSGWMDGGNVSTGTLTYLVETADAQEFAEIEPGPFYLYNFPGSMEVSALFRPETKIEDGLVASYEEPVNRFFYSEAHNLVLFRGKEPNLRWGAFAESILALAETCGVTSIWFVGSVSGLVPHTRPARFHGAVSESRFKPLLREHDIAPSNYEGPASFVTYLNVLAGRKALQMTSLVAEIPAYIEGKNVKVIEASARILSDMLGLDLDLGDLKAMRIAFEERLNEAVEARPELAERIRGLEAFYDKQASGFQEAEMRDWFVRQGFRLN